MFVQFEGKRFQEGYVICHNLNNTQIVNVLILYNYHQ